jgi:protein TonB
MPPIDLADIDPPPFSPPRPPDPPPGEPDVPPPPVIGGRLEPAVLIKQTNPAYPELARTARVEGTVILEGTVSIKGNVETLTVVSGHPMLVDAAIDAVRRWKYRPAKLNGQLIPCPIKIQVRFKLDYSTPQKASEAR